MDTVLTPFLTWQFVVAAVLINATLVGTRRFMRYVRPAVLEQRWFKALCTVSNPLLGLLIGLVPDFLHGERFVERVFVGLCAGFLSHFIYGLFIKRLAPVRDAAAPQKLVPKSEAVTEELDEENLKRP